MPKLSGFSRTPIPGPASSRLLGPVPAFLRFFDDPVGAFAQLRRYGDVVAVSRNNPALVCAFGAERNRDVLSNPRRFHNANFIQGAPGTALGRFRHIIISMNGEDHKRHRRLMMPAFAKSALAGYASAIVALAEAEVERWPIGEVVDLDVYLRELASKMALRTLFGVDLRRSHSELGKVAMDFVEAFSSPLAMLLPYDVPGLPHRRAQANGARLLAILEELIEQKRRSGEGHDDALGLLVHAVDEDGSRFSDEELVSETSTLFFAGHDTTAQTLSWTMFLLERHPAVLGPVLEEIDGVLGGRSVSAEDLPRLTLLDRAIKESMRILSAVPMLVLRVPTQEVTLGDVRLPKDANVVISPIATHHDPALYPQPRRFDPERWATIEPSLYEYLPFGAGPRLCVGAVFARQALRLMLATVLQRVGVELMRGAKVSRLTRANIMRPRYGLPARLHPPRRPSRKPAPIRGDIHDLVELPAS